MSSRRLSLPSPLICLHLFVCMLSLPLHPDVYLFHLSYFCWFSFSSLRVIMVEKSYMFTYIFHVSLHCPLFSVHNSSFAREIMQISHSYFYQSMKRLQTNGIKGFSISETSLFDVVRGCRRTLGRLFFAVKM